MQATSFQQQEEVQQYLNQQPASQAAERRRRRALLDSDTRQPDIASLTASQPSFSSGFSQAGSGPWQGESPTAYGHNRQQSCLMGQSVGPLSVSSGYSSMTTAAMGTNSYQSSLLSNTSYDTIGRGSSWDAMSPATGYPERNEASPYAQPRDWICSFCSKRNQAAPVESMRCSRCRREKVVTRGSR